MIIKIMMRRVSRQIATFLVNKNIDTAGKEMEQKGNDDKQPPLR